VTRAQQILLERRAGLTLREIARRHWTTTERVWQIINRRAKQ
jgi:DNA-binding CsgD family transcriptional regulator